MQLHDLARQLAIARRDGQSQIPMVMKTLFQFFWRVQIERSNDDGHVDDGVQHGTQP